VNGGPPCATDDLWSHGMIEPGTQVHRPGEFASLVFLGDLPEADDTQALNMENAGRGATTVDTYGCVRLGSAYADQPETG
jgi:hypothetical protein